MEIILINDEEETKPQNHITQITGQVTSSKKIVSGFFTQVL